MNVELSTKRLCLIALSVEQLGRLLTNLESLGGELDILISDSIADEPVVRAIKIKLAKMMAAKLSLHPWLTYWLIVIKDISRGVGLIGFKEVINDEGETEIGYGLDTAYWNKGYMAEALNALRDWAFSHEGCQTLVAVTVNNQQSERVLQKCGFQKLSQQGNDTTWRCYKPF